MLKLWGLISWEEKGRNHIWDLNIYLWLQNRAEFKVTDWVAESRCCEDVGWDRKDRRQGGGSRDARQEMDLKTMKEI